MVAEGEINGDGQDFSGGHNDSDFALNFNQVMAAMMLNINHSMIPMMLVMILMKTEELL